MLTATALAHPNIAFIKYWGNRDDRLRVPANSSLSMNLDGLFARTSVGFQPELARDTFRLNGEDVAGQGLERVIRFLDHVRVLAGEKINARVESQNNFPTGAGIASSAAAFAALSLAASRAIGLELSEKNLSRLARLGSGSACRSVPGGYVEWKAGSGDEDSYAFTLVPAEYWRLADCVAVVSTTHKPIGSTEGHALAGTSPLQEARVQDASRRLETVRRAILMHDFAVFAEMVELDSNLMHAVMMTSTPRLFYWEPTSLEIMKCVPHWRAEGLDCCYTLDAGPNVHVICPAACEAQVTERLSAIPGVQKVLSAHPGGPARLV
jgi:diphosphomevalonate decarboxylase